MLIKSDSFNSKHWQFSLAKTSKVLLQLNKIETCPKKLFLFKILISFSFNLQLTDPFLIK